MSKRAHDQDFEPLRRRGLPMIEEFIEEMGMNAHDLSLNADGTSQPPASGLEYLLRVRIEAEACPQIVVAENLPTFSDTAKTNVSGSLNPSAKPTVLHLNQEWKKQFISHFTSLKEQTSLYWSLPSIRKSWYDPETHIKMPYLHQEALWKRFCYGMAEKEGHVVETDENTSTQPDTEVLQAPENEKSDQILTETVTEDAGKEEEIVEEGGQDHEPIAVENRQKRRKRKRAAGNTAMKTGLDIPPQGCEPSLTIVGQCDQRTCLTLLKYHVSWLSKDNLTERESSWIFSLLLRLDPLLLPEDVYILRSLCRRLLLVRSHILESAKETSSVSHDARMAWMNMLISIITVYFRQMDLEGTE